MSSGRVVRVESNFTDQYIPATKLSEGTIGIDSEGNYYYKTMYSLLCLSDPGSSYSAGIPYNKKIKPLPPGSKVTLTIG